MSSGEAYIKRHFAVKTVQIDVKKVSAHTPGLFASISAQGVEHHAVNAEKWAHTGPRACPPLSEGYDAAE